MASLKPLTVIGLNSGTSMDGVDAAVFRIVPMREGGSRGNGSSVTLSLDVEMVASLLYPFEANLQRKMQTLVAKGRATLEEVCRLNAALGEVFARAALEVMRKGSLTRN